MAEYCKYCPKILSGNKYDGEIAFGDCGGHFFGKEVVRMTWAICNDCSAVCKYSSGNGNSIRNYECPDCGSEIRVITGRDFAICHHFALNDNSWAALKKEVESKIQERSKQNG